MDLLASLAANQDPILPAGSLVQVECSCHRLQLRDAAREQDGLVDQVPHHFWNTLDMRIQNDCREISVAESPSRHIEQARRLGRRQVKDIDDCRLGPMNEIDMLIESIHDECL